MSDSKDAGESLPLGARKKARSDTTVSSVSSASSTIQINSQSAIQSSGSIRANTPGGSPGSPGSSGSDAFRDFNIDRKIDEYVQIAISGSAAKIDALFNEKIVFIQQAERKVTKMLDESTVLMGSITKSLEAAGKVTESSVDLQQKLQDEVGYIKGNAIAALSIFVSFFAFITVSISVFSKAESVISAVGLVLIFWCLLIGFNILISAQFKVFDNVRLIWFSLGFVIFLSVSTMVGLYLYSPEFQGVRYIFKFVV